MSYRQEQSLNEECPMYVQSPDDIKWFLGSLALNSITRFDFSLRLQPGGLLHWLVVTGTWLLFSHINWEFHHPNWLSYWCTNCGRCKVLGPSPRQFDCAHPQSDKIDELIFFRGVGQPPTSIEWQLIWMKSNGVIYHLDLPLPPWNVSPTRSQWPTWQSPDMSMAHAMETSMVS